MTPITEDWLHDQYYFKLINQRQMKVRVPPYDDCTETVLWISGWNDNDEWNVWFEESHECEHCSHNKTTHFPARLRYQEQVAMLMQLLGKQTTDAALGKDWREEESTYSIPIEEPTKGRE